MAKRLPSALMAALTGVDLILHAGDFVTEAAVDALEELAPVIGVSGNNDDAAIRARFPPRQLLEWNGFRMGLVHGHEGSGRATPMRALAAFRDEDVDAVIFGHSHIPLIEHREGVLLFNPGSPTDRRRQPMFSYGLLEATTTLEAHHEFYESKL
jgi:putative phosphoesterase